MFRRIAPIAALPVLLAVACGGDADTLPAPTPTPSEGEAVALEGPITWMGETPTLLAEGPTTGDFTAEVEAPSLSLQILLNCTGGDLTIEVVDMATLPYPCELDDLGRPENYGAQIDLPNPQEVTIHVLPASPDVQWRIHVGPFETVDAPPTGRADQQALEARVAEAVP